MGEIACNSQAEAPGHNRALERGMGVKEVAPEVYACILGGQGGCHRPKTFWEKG